MGGNKKQSFADWLVEKKWPGTVHVSPEVCVVDGIMIQKKQPTSPPQRCEDPRYEYENTLPVRPSTPEDHAAILKQEAGGMYGW